MSEQTKEQVERSELSPEQLAKVQEMRNAVSAFMADPRHERYRICPENKTAIEGYLEEHNLDLTEESLHLGFVDLAKQGKLALFDESKIAEPAATSETKNEKKLPPIGQATGADLGVGLADQQRARRQVESGPRSANRNAYIDAGQSAASPKVRGGRFHL